VTDASAAGPDVLVEDVLGVTVPADLLTLALTHRSFANEQGGLPNNERLEFLGDAVLEMVITDALYRRYPDRPEGELAKIRASVVNARACADTARDLGLGPHLLLGRGETATGGHDKTSILADAMEAVLGAVYLGCGLPEATALILRLFDERIRAAAELGAGLDWKTSLQELTARLSLGVPEYVIEAEGPDHDRRFEARVRLQIGDFGHGIGRTKKEAEMQAAQTAYRDIRARHQHGDEGAGTA
jgi:ribonuclease-3